MGRTRGFVRGAAVFAFCLVFSGCVIYPEGEDRKDSFTGFPSTVQSALRNNGVTSFKAPPEIVGLGLDTGYSDYTGFSNTFLFSYTGSVLEDFFAYADYLGGVLGSSPQGTDLNHRYYDWLYQGREGNVSIELGFSLQAFNTPPPVAIGIPPYTLYLLILIY